MARKLSSTPGFVVGTALAGSLNGIALRQIRLMQSGAVDTPQQGNFSDGLFDVAMLVLSGIGLWLLLREMRRGAIVTQRCFWSTALLGGAVFNVAQGIVGHHTIFLALGLAMASVGFCGIGQLSGEAAFKPPPYLFIRNTLAKCGYREKRQRQSGAACQRQVPRPAVKQNVTWPVGVQSSQEMKPLP